MNLFNRIVYAKTKEKDRAQGRKTREKATAAQSALFSQNQSIQCHFLNFPYTTTSNFWFLTTKKNICKAANSKNIVYKFHLRSCITAPLIRLQVRVYVICWLWRIFTSHSKANILSLSFISAIEWKEYVHFVKTIATLTRRLHQVYKFLIITKVWTDLNVFVCPSVHPFV